MNVLADKHHAGLFHSLQLLAARLGWTLYTPIGHDWWDEGYWRFGQGYGDDRLAQQFLVHDFTLDGEFPDAPISTVTLTDARSMDWGFVISSVPDNERGFHRFAQETGAQFVEQVGNTGQWVDWRLDPLVLSSSEMPIDGRGVVYHQEMDPIAFVEPTERRTAASFVNCMPAMGPCWDLLTEAGRSIPIRVHGIDGPAGIVKPYSELLERMSRVGWGWHDKAQGDGFGHVIHSWAAIGRPLVGHASHYRGKMTERFWRDGVTCIDLDLHSVAEATSIIRTIGPYEHDAMCRAIRFQFNTIDYAAEALAITDLLAVPV